MTKAECNCSGPDSLGTHHHLCPVQIASHPTTIRLWIGKHHVDLTGNDKALSLLLEDLRFNFPTIEAFLATPPLARIESPAGYFACKSNHL